MLPEEKFKKILRIIFILSAIRGIPKFPNKHLQKKLVLLRKAFLVMSRGSVFPLFISSPPWLIISACQWMRF